MSAQSAIFGNIHIDLICFSHDTLSRKCGMDQGKDRGEDPHLGK